MTGDCSEIHKSADWGLFLNVGEHVPFGHEEVLIKNVASIPKSGLVVAWGDPKTKDKNPLNRQYDYWVANRFGKYGWLVNGDWTIDARLIIGDISRLDKRLLVMTR